MGVAQIEMIGGEVMKFLSYRKQAWTLNLLGSAVFLTFCVAPRLSAQVTGGTISGVVTDASGAAVPNVDITITNTATALVTKIKTSPEGFYSVPNLLPGPYQVTATSAGFSTAVVNGITLTVGAQQSVNISLVVGETSQQVEVTSSAFAVELASSTLSDVVSGTEVRDMPLNGRSWNDLEQLQPGVNAIHTQTNTNTKKNQHCGGKGETRGTGRRVAEVRQ